MSLTWYLKGTCMYTTSKTKLFLCNPMIESDEPFDYLGRSFDFKMSNEEHKKRLIKPICKFMDIIWLVFNSSKFYHDVGSGNLENKVAAYVQMWLEFPLLGKLNIFSLTKSKYGTGNWSSKYVPISCRLTQCQVTLEKPFLSQSIMTLNIFLHQLASDKIYNTNSTC